MKPAHDVAVLGLGPAGRALTHRLAAAGLSVLAVDPHPDRRWHQTLAGWHRLLPDWLPLAVVGGVAAQPVIRAHRTHRLTDDYAVLDNDQLQQSLDLTGARIEAGTVTSVEPAAARARWVIDCRGASPIGPRRAVPMQTAHGVVLSPADAKALLSGSAAVLMDWTPYDGAAAWTTRPSFLYVIPLPGQGYLAEETCLAGQPALALSELRRRLLVRLRRHGIEPAPDAQMERVSIPMLSSGAALGSGPLLGRRDRGRPRTVRFGAAGAQLNPITGYSVFATLAAVDPLVEALLAGEPDRLPDRPEPIASAALQALLQLSPNDTVDLFDSFGRLSAEHQRAVFTGTGRTLANGLFAQWRQLSAPTRRAMVAASAVGMVRGSARQLSTGLGNVGARR